MKKPLIALVFIFTFIQINAQIKEVSSISIGNTYLINSKTLEENREVQIYLPKSYKDSINKKYPVFYVLDGQDYYSAMVSFQKMLIKRGFFPEFIVVGLKTDQRKRRVLFSRNTTKFIDFLENELIPYVDTKFRTNKQLERIFFGWEVAGGLGIEILAKKPKLFSGLILASPSNLWDFRLNALEKLVSTFKNNSKPPFLLMTSSSNENWIIDNKQLQSIFNTSKLIGLDWRFSILEREKHHTTPFKSINEGVIDYFHNYHPISFRTLKEYENFGGLEGLKKYYSNRGERFDISKEIDETTKMFVLYTAVLENNYKTFINYKQAFEGHIETNTRDSWFHRYAAFYLKHNNTKQALYYYNFALKKLGDSKLLYRGLGDVYAKMNKKAKAKKAYKKALKIDPKYKQALQGLNKL